MSASSQVGLLQVFRPSWGLRLIAAGLCFLSAAVWMSVIVDDSRFSQTAAASVLALPCLAGAAVLLRRISVDDAGLTSHSLIQGKRLLWADIRRVDVRRGSFVIESNVGPVSAALVSPGDRDALLRTIVDRAGLARAADELPWGIEARYVPRRQDIGFTEFVPHHKRKRADPSD